MLKPKALISTGEAGSFWMMNERRAEVSGTVSVSSFARGAYLVSCPPSSLVTENRGDADFVSRGFGPGCEQPPRANTAPSRHVVLSHLVFIPLNQSRLFPLNCFRGIQLGNELLKEMRARHEKIQWVLRQVVAACRLEGITGLFKRAFALFKCSPK